MLRPKRCRSQQFAVSPATNWTQRASEQDASSNGPELRPTALGFNCGQKKRREERQNWSSCSPQAEAEDSLEEASARVWVRSRLWQTVSVCSLSAQAYFAARLFRKFLAANDRAEKQFVPFGRLLVGANLVSILSLDGRREKLVKPAKNIDLADWSERRLGARERKRRAQLERQRSHTRAQLGARERAQVSLG